LINHTLLGLLKLCPQKSLKMLLGPTTPMTTLLFDYGIDMLGITQIDDVELMSNYALLGGGSIANAPAGALRSLNMARDLRALQERISALAR
jgi:hypothetical protein